MLLDDKIFYKSYEIIGGEKIMSPAANIKHGSIVVGLITTIGVYVRNNRLGYVFPDSMDLHLPDGSLLKPDFMFISKDSGTITQKNIFGTVYGVPDMVAEVLSKSTWRNDVTIKKSIYEKNGVKEYWIIDPWKNSISVYLLRDEKFELDGEYIHYDEIEWRELTDEEKSNVKTEIKVSIFEDLTVNLEDIFAWGNF